jgi:hypothetical protein
MALARQIEPGLKGFYEHLPARAADLRSAAG